MDDEPRVIPIFRELEIHDVDAIDDLVAAVDQRLAPPWSHDVASEAGSWSMGNEYRVYLRSSSEAGPGLRLYLLSEPGLLRVANITPIERSRLTVDEYNAALVEFLERFLDDALQSLGLTPELTGDSFDLATELPSDVFAALQSFSALANKSTGSSNPRDQERWFDFLVGLHQSDGELSSYHLAEWLRLDGWSDEMASELAGEFEQAMGLLGHADRH